MDVNIESDLWDLGGTTAGQGFRKTIDRGKIPLVLGGSRLKKEFGLNNRKQTQMKDWIQRLQLAGHIIRVSDDEVDRQTKYLQSSSPSTSGPSLIKSNDHHIIALAQISGARLLYTNDKDLATDFRNKQIIDSPRGKVYNARRAPNFDNKLRKLLAQSDLCSRGD